MKRFFLCICLAIATYPTFAQIQYGSLGVAYYSKDKDKIIMAADSRALMTNGAPPVDNYCKIAAPHRKIIFVATGSGGHKNRGPADPVQSWSGTEEIHRAYDIASLLPTTNSDLLWRTASEWIESVSHHFDDLYRSDPQQVIDLARIQNGGLIKAFIGGMENDGKLILFKMSITFRPSITGNIHYEKGTVLPCPESFCPLGDIDIAEEFIKQTSARANKEAREWKPPKTSKPEDYEILKTMRFVKLTEIYNKGNDVAGPIDAVQMTKDGSVHWYAKKENCADD